MPTPLQKAAVLTQHGNLTADDMYKKIGRLGLPRVEFWAQFGTKVWQTFEDNLVDGVAPCGTKFEEVLYADAYRTLVAWQLAGKPALPHLNYMQVEGWAMRWLADRHAANLDTNPTPAAR